MGRKSAAEKLIESVEDEEYSFWLVCYDFQVNTHLTRFYLNWNRIISELGGTMIQYSVFLGPAKASNALSGLAKAYGAQVSKFRVENALDHNL